MAASSAAALIAQHFGGSRVARLAAEKALLSRQASAEQSIASVDAHAEGVPPEASRASSCDSGATDQRQQPCSSGDDEALLLTDLLNTAAPPGVQHPLGRWSLRQNPLLETGEAVPERSSSSSSSLGSKPSRDALPAGVPAAPHEELSASTAASAVETSGLQDHSQSGMDAADEDTVLTGSPVVCSQRSGGSPEPSTLAAPTAAPQAPAAAQGTAGSVAPAQKQRRFNELGDTSFQGSPLAPAAKAVACSPQPAVPAARLAVLAAPTSQPQALPQPASRPKQAVQQRQWSFADIPQGTASIPSKPGSCRDEGSSCTTKRAPAGGGGTSSPRPAFYTRAASPPPQPLSAVPTAPKPAACGGAQAVSAAQRRRQRLEQLAQPRHAAPRRQQQQQQQQQRGSQGAAADDSPAAPQQQVGSPLVSTDTFKAGPLVLESMPALAAADGCIGAWRTQHAGAQRVPAQPGRTKQGRQSGTASGSRRWPQGLGKEADAAELQRATGAYSEERFQRNLGQLSAKLAQRQQERRRAADATSAGVEELVCQVRQLGATAPARAGAGAADMRQNRCSPPAGHAATAAAGLGEAAWEHRQKQQQQLREEQAVYGHGSPAQLEWQAAGHESDAGSQSENEPGALAQSPTERLLHCRQRLLQRPQTAVPLGAGSPSRQLQRPSTSSPCRVKPLMQVKGEQDWAIRQLSMQAQPFRASPLPLSTMEPRYQQQAAQQESRRQAALDQRRQELVELQRPFGFEEREAERRQRRLLVHGSLPASDGAGEGRPHTPPVFRAQPVPVSTTEARYALLVAEMQLQNRSVQGRGLASPPKRPSTSAPHLALSGQRQRLATAPPLSDGHTGTAAAQRVGASSRFGTVKGSTGASSAAGSAWSLAAAAAAVTAAAGPDFASTDAGEAAGGAGCSTPGAEGVQQAEAVGQGAPVEQLPGAGNAGSQCRQAEAERCAVQRGAAQHAEQEAGIPAGRRSTDMLLPLPQVALPPAGAVPASASPCAMATSVVAAGLPTMAYHGLGGGASWEASGLGEEEAPLPQRVNHLSPLPVAAQAVCAAVGGLVALRVGSRGSSIDGSGLEGQAAAAAAAAAATATQEAAVGMQSPCSMRGSARSSPTAGPSQCVASGWQEAAGGRREASFGAGDAGIAVPVCILPACRAAMAAGGGVELLAAADSHEGTDFGDGGWTPQQAQQGQGAGAAGKPPRWERRDTPPQHVAARHRQVEAVARREVQQLLAKRGSSILGLMEGLG